MRRFVESRWFGLADLACVSVAILSWELKPELQAWPLIVALAPWVWRILDRKFLFSRTLFDISLLIFLLTALVGVRIAYNPVEAANKFWLVIGGILLFYSIARQPQANLRIIAFVTSILGPGMAIIFLLTNNWSINPAKIGILNTVGLIWMKLRLPLPALGIDPHPNLASGVIAFTAPFLIYFGMEAWKEKKFYKILFVSAGAFLSVTGLLLATSRGAVIGLAGGMGVWLALVIARRWRIHIPANRKLFWFVAGLSISLAAAWLVFSFIGGSGDLETNIDTASSAGSRLELSHSAIKLLGDFPFSGGGLHSFGGLYSHYVQVIPIFKVINSHNQYLDIALEQGLLGLLAFLLIYIGSFWLIWSDPDVSDGFWLGNVFCAGFVTICIHGLFDDFVYNAWLTPLIFFLPGLVFAVTRPTSISQNNVSAEKAQTRPGPNIKVWNLLLVGAGLVILTILAGYINRNSILASLYSNIGSIEMAKVELANFPSGNWDRRQNVAILKPAETLFLQALELDPQNRTANHRLGLLAVNRWDFQSAVSYLEAANRSDPSHRGIWKSLGYAYVWIGRFDLAYSLLGRIPEAQQEMKIYAWWWGAQGRDDLAKNAGIMQAMLPNSP